MCRHLAYLGPPVRLGALLADPPHGLVRQSWAPRRQRYGTVNADGFGVGWYVDGHPEPARHRGAGPIWADETAADLFRVVTSTAVLAAVRSATPGMPAGAAAAAPLRTGRWLFSHNGRIDDWPRAAAPLAARLAPERLLDLAAGTDSALLWALTHDLLQRGRTPGQALAEVVHAACGAGPGRFNLLLTDGRSIAATACGDTLVWRCAPALPPPDPEGAGRAGTGRADADMAGARGAGPDAAGTAVTTRPGTFPGVVVASEPYDDGPGWHEVPDGSLLLAGPEGVVTEPL